MDEFYGCIFIRSYRAGIRRRTRAEAESSLTQLSLFCLSLYNSLPGELSSAVFDKTLVEFLVKTFGELLLDPLKEPIKTHPEPIDTH